MLADIVYRCRVAIAICGVELGRLGRRADELAANQAEWQLLAEQALAAGDESEASRLLTTRVQVTDRLNRLHRARDAATRANQELFDLMTELADRLSIVRSAPPPRFEPPSPADRHQAAQAEQAIERVRLAQSEAAKLADGIDPLLTPAQLAELVSAALAAARKAIR